LSRSAAIPLFLLLPNGQYAGIARQLEPILDRPVLAVPMVELADGSEDLSVEAATDRVERYIASRTDGAVAIAGYCRAGLEAYEFGVRRARSGHRGKVILIHSRHPREVWRTATILVAGPDVLKNRDVADAMREMDAFLQSEPADVNAAARTLMQALNDPLAMAAFSVGKVATDANEHERQLGASLTEAYIKYQLSGFNYSTERLDADVALVKGPGLGLTAELEWRQDCASLATVLSSKKDQPLVTEPYGLFTSSTVAFLKDWLSQA
jgi:hypothetical protein